MSDPSTPSDPATDSDRVVVLTPQGMGVHDPDDEQRGPADLVEHPAKVMRVASMVKQLLEEVRSAPLDEAGRARLARIHQQSIAELKDGLHPELVAELDRLALSLRSESCLFYPSDLADRGPGVEHGGCA